MREGITLHQVRVEKEKLRKAISHAIGAFQAEVGTAPSSIDIQLVRQEIIGREDPKFIQGKIFIDVRI